MAYFIYRENSSNPVVNLDMCSCIYKDEISGSNGGSRPVITFFGCEVRWIFQDEEERDLMFGKLKGLECIHNV
jgi:hypothetical protein